MIPQSCWQDAGSPWRTTDECARYLRFFDVNGATDRQETIAFLDKAGARKCKRGRSVLYLKADVEAALVPQREARTA